MIRPSQILLYPAAAALFLLASSCAPHRVQYYQLSALAKPAAPAETGPVVLVGRITTPQALQDGRIRYRDGLNTVGAYEYHRWTDPPGIMVKESLIHVLRTSGKYKSVQEAGSSTDGDFTVRGKLLEFSELDGNGIMTRRFPRPGTSGSQNRPPGLDRGPHPRRSGAGEEGLRYCPIAGSKPAGGTRRRRLRHRIICNCTSRAKIRALAQAVVGRPILAAAALSGGSSNPNAPGNRLDRAQIIHLDGLAGAATAPRSPPEKINLLHPLRALNRLASVENNVFQLRARRQHQGLAARRPRRGPGGAVPRLDRARPIL